MVAAMPTRMLPFLVVACAHGQIAIGPPQEISDFFGNPRFTQAMDMDGDGDLDVIAASDGTSRISWWENNGSGEFGNRHDWDWGIEAETIGLTDYDGDGRLDVWLARLNDGLGRIWLAKGQPGGGFPPPVSLLQTGAVPLLGATVIDINADGRQDVVGESGVFFQQPDGSFNAPPPVATSAVESGLFDYPSGRWAFGAFGGGPQPQLLWWEWPGKLFRSRVQADGSFEAKTLVFTFPANQFTNWITHIPPAPGGDKDRLVVTLARVGASGEDLGMRLVLLGFDAAGSAGEIASTTAPESFYPDGGVWDQQRQRLLINGWIAQTIPNSRLTAMTLSGDTVTLTPVFDFHGMTSAPLLADLDGDAIADLMMPLSSISGVAGAFFDQLAWHRGNSSGGFAPPPRPINQAAFARTLTYAGDLDGDGDGDIITTGTYPTFARIGSLSHELVVWRNQGATFTREILSDEHEGIGVISVKDRNSDGRHDLLVQTLDRLRFPDGSVSTEYTIHRILAFTQNHTGSFTPVLLREESVLGGKWIFGEVDWNGDGIADLIVAHWVDSLLKLSYIPGPALGTPEAEIPIASDSAYDAPRLIDMDWDGDLDLVSNGTLLGKADSYWYENDGHGEVNTIHQLPTSIVPLGVDLDGDGHEDFKNSAGFYLSRPEGSFAFKGAAMEPLNLDRTKLLDLDQDGDPDLVVADDTSSTIPILSFSWLENLRSGPADSRQFLVDAAVTGRSKLPIAPARMLGYQAANGIQTALADMDGDGMPDLVTVWAATYMGSGRVEWFKVTKPPTPAPFAAWMGESGLIGNSAGPLADWDGDGNSNWTEFAFGSSPSTADPLHAALPRLRQHGQGLSFCFQRRTDADTVGLSYLMQHSENLNNWTSWAPGSTRVPAATNYETVTIPITPSLAREFFRIAVPPPP
jgi:hypothetical protein